MGFSNAMATARWNTRELKKFSRIVVRVPASGVVHFPLMWLWLWVACFSGMFFVLVFFTVTVLVSLCAKINVGLPGCYLACLLGCVSAGLPCCWSSGLMFRDKSWFLGDGRDHKKKARQPPKMKGENISRFFSSMKSEFFFIWDSPLKIGGWLKNGFSKVGVLF